MWTSSAQKWVSIPHDVLQYAEQPEDFGEVLRIAAENRRSSEAEANASQTGFVNSPSSHLGE
ncbi:MAG: hypothetical protein ACI808_003086 [Paraglaciecola sp.]